jgi:triacylglycerol esterase/lipase EstA (alpha/beta hydrolase family)
MRSIFAILLLAVVTIGSLAIMTDGSAMAAGAISSGYNNWSCTPSAAHPQPVVLLHGLGATYYEDLGNVVAPYLVQAGYCVYGATYGATSVLGPFVGGLGDIADSGRQIGHFIDRVLAATHASKVDLVGHSEGAFMSNWVPKVDGFAPEVERVVAIAPPTHGTTFGGLVTIAQALKILPEVDTLLIHGECLACAEIIDGGSAITTLDHGPIAQPGVSYTIIASKSDELVTPTSTAFVHEAGVQNVYIQTTCPLDPVGHLGEAYDGDVEQMIVNALDPATATKVACTFGPPL